jgi:8-oxo-dGTP pyrophosphatase MutT (NUDIX family)
MKPQEVQIHCLSSAASFTRGEGSGSPRGGYARRVRNDRPGPAEELNAGRVAPARPAASLILLRDTPAGPEVLLVERNRAQRFMGGAWVFPGGAVHDDDDAGSPPAAAIRELEEEAGIRLGDPDALVPFSRWITPAEVKTRFDTFFYAARAPAGVEPRPDGSECVAARWLRPSDALDAYARGELHLVFPTIKHLEQLAEFGSVDETLRVARGREVLPIQPQVRVDQDTAQIVLPGEPGYRKPR